MPKIKEILISIAFFFLGWFLLLKTDAEVWICWATIIFFGGGAALLIGVDIHDRIRGKKIRYGNNPIFELKDGKNYKVLYSDMKISLVDVTTGQKEEMRWKDIREIFVAAIDKKSKKYISWTIHNEQKAAIEIPWGATGADALPIELLKRTNEFKQTGDYEIKEYFQGFKVVWEKA